MGNPLLEKAIKNPERPPLHHERAPLTLNGHSLFIEGHYYILNSFIGIYASDIEGRAYASSVNYVVTS